jgi:hypothetical protein
MPMLMKLIHLFKILQVPSCLPAARGATAMMARPSSSSPEGKEPWPKKARFGAFLRVSSWYACGVLCCLCAPYFSCFLP